ncbi:hypothetical protein AWC25_00440 [Mycobacterium sherrisii]|nr:hypothetical protein AWC25_00440 [Mycobacterium sherrisii]
MLVFTVLFVVYLHARGPERDLFASSQDHLNRSFGAINTLILLTSSIIVVFATRALKDPRWQHLASRLTIAGVLVGTCFVVVKLVEYTQKVHAGITPTTNHFYMYYFVLKGSHLVHVLIGLTVLTVLSRFARKPAPAVR